MPVLTEKQTAFLRALAEGAVPSEAYRIGFGHKQNRPWMRQSAHVLMREPKMAPFVEAARADYRRHLEAATEAAAAAQAAQHAALLGELGVSRESVVRALAAIAFADLGEMGEAAAVVTADAAAGTGKLRLTVRDKLAALGMLAKMLGLFDRAKDAALVDNSLNLRIFIDGEEQGGPVIDGKEAAQPSSAGERQERR
jgi:hypothetical protein